LTEHRWFALVLLALGLGWGLTQPLGKLATTTGHQPFGLIFWQLVICTIVLGALSLSRGKGLVLTRPALVFSVVVAVLGTLVPNATFYASVEHLPSGIMSILISAVPLLSFPIALMLGMDRFSAARLAGLALGLIGVAIIAAPGAGLPAHLIGFIPLALVGPLFYAMEANYVAKRGTAEMDAVQAMFMASLVGLLLCLPVTMATGQWIDPRGPWGAAEWGLIGSSVVHAFCYAGYVWLASRAGAVFAAQCSYLVTGAGVIWAMLILGERLDPWIWVALAVMLSGVALVQPRQLPRAGQEV
jgi:drug/metabolite transporter (DMT)-like permease